MTGNDDLVCFKVKAAISFMNRGVTKKNTRNRTRLKLVGIVKVMIAKTPEDTKVSISGIFLKEFLVWGVILKGGGGRIFRR